MKADNQNTTISCGINISYGLTIAGINGDYDTYLNKYTGKELQTGEFDPMLSTGLEMLDYSQSHLFFEGAHEIASLSFGSRFYDPQLGRWFTPDPAEQFANPYLAMGTTRREESFRWKDLASGELVGATVVYVDPDGEVAFIVPVIIGAVISAATYTTSVAMSDGGFQNWDWGQFGLSVGIGALTGAAGGAIGGMTANAINTGYFALGYGSAAIGSVSGAFAGAAVGAASGFAAGFCFGLAIQLDKWKRFWHWSWRRLTFRWLGCFNRCRGRWPFGGN